MEKSICWLVTKSRRLCVSAELGFPLMSLGTIFQRRFHHIAIAGSLQPCDGGPFRSHCIGKPADLGVCRRKRIQRQGFVAARERVQSLGQPDCFRTITIRLFPVGSEDAGEFVEHFERIRLLYQKFSVMRNRVARPSQVCQQAG